METWQLWVAVGSLAFTIVVSVGGATVRLTWWLAKQFTGIKDAYAKALKDHEAQDEKRHEENLERFGAINVAIARIRPGRHPNSGDEAHS
jgi:hypothetical protein